jgi:alkylation response protein AidB-like acyl-CoA dehydrogenase
VLVGATEEQREKWLGKIAEEGILFAYGATEPEAGSDLGSLTTTAVPKTDDDGNVVSYVINGRKQWISNGGIADASTILALTDGGPTWFVVERGTPGFEAAPHEDKHGIRLSNTCALFLDDVEVPVENLVGGVEGQGLVQAQQVFGYTRLMVAAFGLGGGWAAVDRAITYAFNRIQGGSPLSEKQGLTHKLIVPHVVRLEAARAYIEETATRIDAGEGENGALNTEGAIAKYLATEAGNSAAEAAIQVHGGYGYTRPYIVEKIKRDVRITTIYEGTSEIMEMTIGRDRWQQHLKTRGQHFHDLGRRLEGVHAEHATVGADIAALAAHALAEIMERARAQRLTRNQHVLFRIGELVSYVEAAAAFARHAVRAEMGELNPKSPTRFSPPTVAAMARVFAREAAQRVAVDGMRWVVGAQGAGAADVSTLEASARLSSVYAAQAGLIDDMNQVGDAVYERS